MKLRQPILIALLLGCSTVSVAEPYNATQTYDIELSDLDKSQANYWSLDNQEWIKYKRLVDGPRGTWSPTLDPIEVLGIHAETETERKKYAMLYIKMQEARVKQELAFYKTLEDTRKEYYKDMPLMYEIKNDLDAGRKFQYGDKLLFFVSPDCQKCNAALKRNIRTLDQYKGMSLDIFVVGAKNDNDIRLWASSNQIDIKRIQSGEITLNHDKGSLEKLTKSKQTKLPMLIRKRGQNYTTID